MDKFRVTAYCKHGREIGSWVFNGPREKAIAKTMDRLLDVGCVPAEIHAELVENFSQLVA